MKNLKKVLAVVLAVAMAFSLMAVAGAKQIGDYSDTSDVKYKEAVDLISGLGIMTGTSETTFDPKGTFTREQAAKVICILLVGKTVADSLQATTKTFDDVEVTRWSAPFIEYCAVNGIINGTGDGKFSPAAPVTGSAFAKMLLTALGYGAKGEYVGANWELNTLVKAQGLGILDTGVDYKAPATREEVAKYAFNALTGCKPVTYNSVTGTYANTYTYTKTTGSGTVEDEDRNLLGYATFQLKKEPYELSYYGYKAHYWKAYTTTVPQIVSGYYSDDNVLYTGTMGAPFSILNVTTPNSGFYQVSLDFNKANTVPNTTVGTQIYVNGLYQETLSAPIAASNANNLLSSAAGNVVKYIDNDKNGLAEVIYIYDYDAAYMAVAPVVDAAGNTTISASAKSGTYPKGRIVCPTGIGAYDYFSYIHWAGGAGPLYIEKATKVEGQVTSIFKLLGGSLQYSMTIGGKSYTQAGYVPASNFLSSASNFNVPVTAWVDFNGYLIFAQPTVASSYNYGLVVGYAYNPVSSSNLVASAQVILTTNDGKTATYNVATDPATGVVPDQRYNASNYPYGFGTGAPRYGALVAYSFDGNNNVTVTPVPLLATNKGAVGTCAAYTGKSSTITLTQTSALPATALNGGYFINANTKVFYFDGSQPYVPGSNVPGVLTGPGSTVTANASTSVSYVVDPLNDRVLNAIFFDMADGPTGATGNYVYFTSNAYTWRVVNGVTYYDYSGYVNGADKATTLTATRDLTSLINKGAYTYMTDANGNVTSFSALQSPSFGQVYYKVTYVDSSIIGYTDGTNYLTVNVDSNTKFYQVNPNTSVVTAAPIIASVPLGTTTYLTNVIVNTSAAGNPAACVYFIVTA